MEIIFLATFFILGIICCLLADSAYHKRVERMPTIVGKKTLTRRKIE